MAKFGGTSSILAGMVFALSGSVFYATQVGQFDWNSIRSISEYFAENAHAYDQWKLVNGTAAFASLLAIGGVLALSDLARSAHEGLVRWSSTLAIIGYTIIAVTNLADLDQINRLATGYPELSETARSAVEIIGTGSLDPTLRLRFITLGTWISVVGWLSLSDRILPKELAYFGIIAGALSLSFALASLFNLQLLSVVAGGVAVVFHPIWLIWTGIVLRQLSQHSSIHSK